MAPASHDLEVHPAAAPRDDGILFLLGFAYLKKHDGEKAKAIFQLMFEAAGAERAQFLLGKANYEATLFPQAEESFFEVLRLNPKFPGVHLELGKVYISLRRTDDAIRELELLLKENPADADASYFLGGGLAQLDRYTKAIPHLETARKGKPDFWAPYFYFGKAKLKLEQPAEAVVLLQRTEKL